MSSLPLSIDNFLPEIIMEDKEHTAVAAIIHGANDTADSLLAEFARHLRGQGWRVQGVVKEDMAPRKNCTREMVLVDLDDDTRYLISQDLGPAAISCRVDPRGVAAASISLRRGLAEEADLVVANRFGELEAKGGGFAAEMLELMANGVPLLTVVVEKFLPDWRRFTGSSAAELPPQRDALDAWFASIPRKP